MQKCFEIPKPQVASFEELESGNPWGGGVCCSVTSCPPHTQQFFYKKIIFFLNFSPKKFLVFIRAQLLLIFREDEKIAHENTTKRLRNQIGRLTEQLSQFQMNVTINHHHGSSSRNSSTRNGSSQKTSDRGGRSPSHNNLSHTRPPSTYTPSTSHSKAGTPNVYVSMQNTDQMQGEVME